MISIITAIHNQLAMNKLFFETLKQYTFYPFELIVIDNASTDGSAEYFEQQGATVIRNEANYSYPYCQNQGIRAAKFAYYAFLNNDIIVAPQWDKLLLQSMHHHQLDVATVCGIERTQSVQSTKHYGRRWKRIKHMIALLGINGYTLRLMHRLMYGSWEAFCAQRSKQFHLQIVEGFVGNSVMMSRRAIDLLGLWDERIQGADFDLYVRSKKRYLEHGDIKPCHIALDVFHHHFIRITVKSKPPAFADQNNLISLEEKWGKEALRVYLKDNVET